MKIYQQSIGIIVCHFGKMPWYFDYFLHSCKFNPTVDFFIISDDTGYPKPLPANVRFIYKSLHDINEIASRKLGLASRIEHAYKICDYKPAFGLLFSEILEGYDFWGQCDIDVIWGDIRGFIEDDLLGAYDFINVRHDYTAGCFYLLRNNATMNNFFKRSRDYEKVFSSSKHYCFDECNFAHGYLRQGKSIFEVKTEIESFTHIIKAAEARKEIKAYFDFLLIEGVPGRIRFDRGKIIYRNRFEAILYHLIGLKKRYQPKQTRYSVRDSYHVSPTRIYTRNKSA